MVSPVDQEQQIISAITGFSVATAELTGYVRDTRRLADELTKLATHQIRSVRAIDEASFGKIGKETGFAIALDHFAEALQRQVSGVAKNADAVSDTVAKTARDYRNDDRQIADELLDLLT